MSAIARIAAAALCLGAATAARAANAPEPIFVENFISGEGDGPYRLVDRWVISGRLQPAVQALRIVPVRDSALDRVVARITVQQGDALSGAKAEAVANVFVCDKDGSRLLELEAQPGSVLASERVEMQVRHNHETGAGELVRFNEAVWYRFGLRIADDWPHDRPTGVRPACRTVIHQVKQDSFVGERSCDASPFFKIEARPLDGRIRFFAQITFGSPCTAPDKVQRVQLCVVEDMQREAWYRVNVRLLPKHLQGEADVWLNGRHCGTYRGAMGDPENGAKMLGREIVNVQPRFGLYRDRRAETQTIYLDRIAFWNTDPGQHPDWGVDTK